MAKVESKTKTTIDMEVIGRDGIKKGHFVFTSGNMYYYRANAKKSTAQLSYQQLIELIENNIDDH